jgi:hypothetical protein
MGITIDGRGPLENWGKNAAMFRELINQQGSSLALMADTQVVDPNHLDKNATTLKGDKALADVFDFATTQISFLDTQDHNGQVSQNEFLSALGLTPQAVQVATTDAYHAALEDFQAQQPGPMSVQQAVALQAEAKATVTGEYTSSYGQALNTFNALDPDENGQITTPELANYIRLQDTGMDHIRQSLLDNQVLTNEQLPSYDNLVALTKGLMGDQTTGQSVGTITATENLFSSVMLAEAPEVIKDVLGKMAKDSPLDDAYAAYQKDSGPTTTAPSEKNSEQPTPAPPEAPAHA